MSEGDDNGTGNDAATDRLMKFIEGKFEEMKEENEGLRRKVKKQEEKQVKFDKKSHEVQFLFNMELLEKIEEIQDGVGRFKTDKVKQLLEDMIKKIKRVDTVADVRQRGLA